MTVLDRLDGVLDRRGLSAVWFARPNSFAWLTGGDNVVDRDADVGVAAAGYDGEDVIVVTDSIEGPRLAAEELDSTVDLVTFPWYESSLSTAVERISPKPGAADFDVEGFESISAAPLRQPLTSEQIDRYRELGQETAAAVEEVVRDLEPADTELEVTGRLRGTLEERAIETPVVLVAGSERAKRFRHYTPKDVELDEYALATVTVKRGGLFVSCTRTVAFDAPAWLEDRTVDAMTVDVTALEATRRVARTGGTAGDVFAAIQDAYEAVGWDEEWKHHHQGGAAGFAGREWIATPTSEHPVCAPMGYAWNPTIQGAKSEDTFLVTADTVEQFSTTGEWPTRSVESIDGTLELERHDVLDV